MSTPIGNAAALVTVRWILVHPRAGTLEDYRDSYLVARIKGDWRFVGDVVHASAG